jgi:phosphotransferase system enzyme I (PtsP)
MKNEISYSAIKETRNRGLVTLQRIIQEVGIAPNHHEASRIIVSRVKQAIKTDVCSIYLIEPQSQILVLTATDGLSSESVGKVRLKSGEGLVGLVAIQKQPVNIRNASTHPHFKLLSDCHESRFRGFLGVPVMHRGDTLGVIVVQQFEERRYRDTDVAFLVTLATQLAGIMALAYASDSIELNIAKQNSNSQRFFVDAIAGSPGFAIGNASVLISSADLATIPDRVPDNLEQEEKAFRSAIKNVTEELYSIQNDFRATLLPEDSALFEALAMIASSDTLIESTITNIHAGNWAPGALRETIEEYTSHFDNIEDPYLRERARDIRDLGRRILIHLQQSEDTQQQYLVPTILVGEDLGPIDLTKVPAHLLVGIVSGHGAPLSHLSILARAMGIPAIVGIAGVVASSELDGKSLIIDGYRGRLYINPDNTVREEYTRLIHEEQAIARDLEHLKNLPAVTTDGFRIQLQTNAGILSDLNHSVMVGSEGIGLYRTELTFMIHDQFPGEEEQATWYRQILQSFAPKPVTLRTLDIGSDKVLPYFPVTEPNPALGWRGIRFSLDNPVILAIQLRAMMRASSGLENLRILIPMISNIEEAEHVQNLIQRTWQELKDEGVHVAKPYIGYMIEVPSAVYQAGELARLGDFLSVGTNDLIQYLLAVDRSNERVGKRFDPLHPAVIMAVLQVVSACKNYNKPVSICGQAAGDPAMAILLLGMGIHSLSMSASDLPRIKAVIRKFSKEEAQSILNDALQLNKSSLIRDMLSKRLMEAGLDGLVRVE